MATTQPAGSWYREYDLVEERIHPSSKIPASHQIGALEKLRDWYESRPQPDAGGILVLPTGAGKTFTAIHFLCSHPLSQGYKLLWLAHTHHLLEQAFKSFDDGVSLIAEPRSEVAARVVSGTIGHFPVHSIKPSDDVIIGTVQTLVHAHKEQHRDLLSWLDPADGRLVVVFDEAHHSPAPSYRKLVFWLRERFPDMYLLGLTATPTYTDETKRGWLADLFPQGIIHQVLPQRLMAEGILAKPVIEEPTTNYTPTFDERQYQLWVATNRDLPERIITQLALNRDRNLFIAGTYVANRKRYGKTIIFADRWYQCEQLSEFLRARHVRTGTVYSHIDADPGSAEARNRRRSTENAEVLADFRASKLDVLINVRMLTEGTDVPDVNTVFLTRGTTSQILLTQMVGRALRGPKFGGTPEAYIVSFIDNWKQLINWAEYGKIDGGRGEGEQYGERPPLQLISIELVQQLARVMYSGRAMDIRYVSMLPLGWYRVEYTATVESEEATETIRQLVMVFEDEQPGFEALIAHLCAEPRAGFDDEGLRLDDVRATVTTWETRFFGEAKQHFGGDLGRDVLSIARHIAQHGVPPRFFPFERRELHDLDAIARRLIAKDVGPRDAARILRKDYNSRDRYWSTLYHTFELFKSHCDACINRELLGNTGGEERAESSQEQTETPREREPSEEVKAQVIERDERRCVCCGCESRRKLQVDHVAPWYYGGSNLLDNLQTLCSSCNRAKGTHTIIFRDHETDLRAAPATLPELDLPAVSKAREPIEWDMFLRRTINLFFRCGAVHEVQIRRRGEHYHHWLVELRAGNDPEWLAPHLGRLLERVRVAKAAAGYGAPESITVWGPDRPEVSFSAEKGVEIIHSEIPRDWFFKTGDSRHPGAWQKMLEQSVMALWGFGDGEDALNLPAAGERIFAYVSGQGIVAVGRSGKEAAFPSGSVFRKKTRGEYHCKVTWEAVVDAPSAVTFTEVTEWGYRLPVRRTLSVMEDREVAQRIADELARRATP